MIRVGIVDSGIDGAARTRVIAARDFPATPATADGTARDASGHGSRVAAIVAGSPAVELLDARIFQHSLRASATQVAEAIDWLCTQQARVVNLSVGLREDREVLRAACARAVAQRVLLVASSPARGEPVFPAAYPGVLRATGDARCARGEISWLGTAQADCGGHVRSLDDAVAGASIGCAHVCAALAAWLADHPEAGHTAAIDALRSIAAWHGPERRGSIP